MYGYKTARGLLSALPRPGPTGSSLKARLATARRGPGAEHEGSSHQQRTHCKGLEPKAAGLVQCGSIRSRVSCVITNPHGSVCWRRSFQLHANHISLSPQPRISASSPFQSRPEPAYIAGCIRVYAGIEPRSILGLHFIIKLTMGRSYVVIRVEIAKL